MENQVEELREQNAQARKVREWRSANNLDVKPLYNLDTTGSN